MELPFMWLPPQIHGYLNHTPGAGLRNTFRKRRVFSNRHTVVDGSREEL